MMAVFLLSMLARHSRSLLSQRVGLAQHIHCVQRTAGSLRACATVGDLHGGGDLEAVADETLAARLPQKGGAIQKGTCYYVGTPIGNLEDITLRAVRTLRDCDVVAAEDTRVASSLLRHLGTPRKQLVSHHDHNLGSSVPKLISLLQGGASVAVVSDAGTPGISDPGLALAAACAQAGVPLVPVPGPCAAVAALSVSGLAATEFVFAGFLERKGKVRRERVATLSDEPRCVVLYEAPHRLLDTLGDLAAAGNGERGVLVAREITKLHEELHRGSVRSAYEWFRDVAERDGKLRGEFTVVLAPLDEEARAAQKVAASETALQAATEALAERLAAGERVSKAAKTVAAEHGLAKAKVYAIGLELDKERKAARRAHSRAEPQEE